MAEFTLVTVVLVLLFLAVLQLGWVMHIRNTLVASAAEGARYGAAADRGPADAVARTRELAAASVSAALPADVSAGSVVRDGVAMVEVRVRTTLPLVGLLGVDRGLEVVGHAVEERA